MNVCESYILNQRVGARFREMRPSLSSLERPAELGGNDSLGSGAEKGKAAQIKAMFSSIARRYDLLNTVPSSYFDEVGC